MVSGWLLSRGLATARHTRSLENLGYRFPPGRAGTQHLWSIISGLHKEHGYLRDVPATLVGCAVGYSVVGPVGLVIGAVLVSVVLRARRARAATDRRDLLDRQLGEAIVSLATAVRAGLSVRQAVEEAAQAADQPLRGELESVVQRLSTGEPLDTALSRLHRRVRLSDAALVVNALAVHRRTGGDLPALLEEIARVIRLRLEDRRAARALTAQARSSGVVLAVLPVVFVALLSGTGGDGLGAFYRTPAGASLLLSALGLQGLGFAWMRRIVQRVEDH